MGKRKTLDSDGIWRPKKLKIQYTDDLLTAGTGLDPLVDAFVKSPQYLKLKGCVPSRNSNASYDSGKVHLRTGKGNQTRKANVFKNSKTIQKGGRRYGDGMGGNPRSRPRHGLIYSHARSPCQEGSDGRSV